MKIMETWRSVLTDWVNAVNVDKVPMLNSQLMPDQTFFFLLMKTLSIQSLDITTKQRLMKFVESYHSRCGAGEVFMGENIDGTYLTSLLLVNSSLGEGFHRFLTSKLDPVTKNHVDMYLSLILSTRDRISKEIIEMLVTHSKETLVKYSQSNPIDLSHRQVNEYERMKLENFTRIDNENNILKNKLTNCQMETKTITEHAIKIQEKLQQSLDEIELLKTKYETIENKYHKASQCISTYASSIDSINVMAKKLVIERNKLKHRVNELEEKLQNNINKMPLRDSVVAPIHNDENFNNNQVSNANINIKNSNNKLQILQVRLERLDQKIIDAVSQHSNNICVKNMKISECVAPMKAKRERIHGRDCWKIVPYSRTQERNILTVKKSRKTYDNNNNNNNNGNKNCGASNNDNEKR